jgi:hypothetical protein
MKTTAAQPDFPAPFACGSLLSLFLLAATSAPRAETGAAENETRSHSHWSLKPLVKPRPPAVQNKSWPRTPIDSFILDRLEQQGLQPSAAADPRSLLRRVTFDLIGLPPTPQEMDAFLADPSSNAYDKAVDRLLASPRYGERWARHWLDAVHYAETHGHDQDRIRTNAWPYRDYVIQSFNTDKPYDRFVREQIAGDVLFPDDPQAVVAMGLLATGPWDESSLRDIREDTIDRQIARYLDRDDIVTTVMNTFVSTTMQCARCHDHKFDPISQEEYYGLQAVFAATDKANRAYDADPNVHRQRRALLLRQKAIERKDKSVLDSLREPALQNELAVWETNFSHRAINWAALVPVSFVSSNNTTLTKQPDGSLLASGARPDTDTYVVTTRTDLKGITAFRLEVLCDDTLPHRGPGRQDNGNLHLTDFRVLASPNRAPSEPQGREAPTPQQSGTSGPAATNAARSLALRNPTADFNQDGWGIARAIDADPKTAWGIYPQVGLSHQAVFELAEPLDCDAGVTLTFLLAQNHGGGHLIGRPRLSVTTHAAPVTVNPLPDAIANLLAIPARRRSDDQRATLALHYLQEKVKQELAALPKPQLVYAGASDFAPDGSFKPAPTPRPVHVLKRGDINKPGAPALARAPAFLPGLDPNFELTDANDEGAARAALARWITHPQNALTWRSIVNRVWHHHFGRGIVDSPNDLGRMGARPTHPELLDWLAVTFRDQGGSFKQLHRLIVTSATYRQTSRLPPEQQVSKWESGKVGIPPAHFPTVPLSAPAARSATELDSDNRLLWRMNPTRLDAESIRDAVLQITGRLDLTMGGPSVQQFLLSPGIHVTPGVDYAKFDVDSPASCRRSIYRFIFRTLPDPFMDTLDCADASQLTPARNVSVTALQALAMLNNHFIVRQSEHFARRVSGAGATLDEQIAAAYRLALNRTPSTQEAADLAAYARQHGLANLCRLILNSNEFMFVN